MSNSTVEANSEVITWARQRAGYSLESARQHFSAIADWESGHVLPTYPQVEQMSDRFKIPVAVFFFPAPPSVPDIMGSFRTLNDSQLSELPPKIQLLLRKARSFQLSLDALCPNGNPSEKQILHDLDFSGFLPMRDAVSRVRDYRKLPFHSDSQ